MEKTRDLFKKMRDSKGTFMQNILSNKGQKCYGPNRSRRYQEEMARGAKSHLESNSIPARDAQRAQTYLVSTRTQRPYRD